MQNMLVTNILIKKLAISILCI